MEHHHHNSKPENQNHNDHHNQHEKHEHGNHDHQAHHAHMIEDFKKRFWISLILTVPILVFSPMIQEFFGFSLDFTGRPYVVFALSSVIFFYGGWPFLTGLVSEIKDKAPGMMTLIAIAIVVAYGYSSAVVFGLSGKIFFWELATLIDVMLLGHWIEMRSVMGASRALEMLVNLMPSEAHLVKEEEVVDVKLEEIQKNDIILIKPGEKVPTDGEVVEGESYFNEAMLTGESKPAKKAIGDQVIGGSVNGDGSVKVKVAHTGEESYLNKVISMVREAQQKKSKTQHLADKAAGWLAYIALGAGIITLAVWLTLGREFAFALERMVTVMVISCPHALGLAIPLVVAISTAVAAQKGLLIRNRTAFESARKISAIVFDKTGTLTEGKFGVSRTTAVQDNFSEKEILRMAAALEQSSEHPIATGIMQKAREMELKLPNIEKFNAIKGKGVEGTLENKEVKVVSPGYLKENNLSIPDKAYTSEAETVVFVVVDGQVGGYIALSDQIRPESYEAVKIFKENNIKVMMATGDNEQTAKAVSKELGLDQYYAEVLPHQKVDIIKDLQQKGEFVAMTGDGVNDAPALAEANIGIAVGSGTDIAAETADIVLVNSNPKDILNLILFGKATYGKMIQNLVWATGYNAVSIPLAAGVAYPFLLSPAVGAALMSLSTIIVAINAQLLKRKT